ncbi:MAG TPA: aldo/keto reductase [Longimicrobium sp.]|nr:aldo/keto reductase [Longimicrobium sp.]
MDTIELGRTGRRVSRVGLGALPLSFDGRPERAAARRVVRRAVELGTLMIDTADGYCLHAGEMGHNERLIAEALDELGRPPQVLVSTKGGITFSGARMEPNGHPWYLRRACERSLRALGVESLDLYYLHMPDPAVPFAESVGELARLAAEGKVRAVGLSNVSLEQLRAAGRIVDVAAVQNHLSPWDRSMEASGMVAYCREHGITFFAHSPAGGAGRVGRLRASEALAELGRRYGLAPVELVIAWVLQLSPSLATIPGASRPESIESSVRAASHTLDARAVEALEEAFSRI